MTDSPDRAKAYGRGGPTDVEVACYIRDGLVAGAQSKPSNGLSRHQDLAREGVASRLDATLAPDVTDGARSADQMRKLVEESELTGAEAVGTVQDD